MQATFHDGRTARAQSVDVRCDDEALIFKAGGEQRWPLAYLRVEVIHDRVRVAPPGDDPARLTLTRADWLGLTEHADAHHRAERRRHLTLVGVLAGAALSIAGVVFVGIPAASGPLARRTPPVLETRIGENLDAQVSLAFRPCGGMAGQGALVGFGKQLGLAAHTPFDIRVEAVHAPMVNAFALPGGRIMVTDQLIEMADSPDELSAVISHETAHVEKRHVMQAVWRSFGFGVLLDAVVGGGTGAGQQAVLLMGSFTNLRYGREAEAEADSAGQDLLTARGLSSQGMAPFFQKLVAKSEGKDAAAVRELISDHPDSQRRAAVSRARAKPGAAAFTPTEWAAIKASCKDGYDPLKRLKKLF